MIAALLLIVAGLQTVKAQKIILHMPDDQKVEYEISQLDSITFVDKADVPSFLTCPDDHHPHAIDLGLPSGTKWCCCNVGASTPEGYGDHFAWGETTTKSIYGWSTYFDTDDNGSTFKKYNINGGLTELQPADDAATANLGNGWRMPSLDQIKELINSDYTTTTWTTQDGISGRKITSKVNGESLFLPAAGNLWHDDLSYVAISSDGGYWSRSLYDSYCACGLDFSSVGIEWTNHNKRYCGRSVRPVRDGSGATTLVTGITISPVTVTLEPGQAQTLTATVLPGDATNKTVTWSSSKTSVATVSTSGKVTAIAQGECTITCSATDGSGTRAECKVMVSNAVDDGIVWDGLPTSTTLSPDIQWEAHVMSFKGGRYPNPNGYSSSSNVILGTPPTDAQGHEWYTQDYQLTNGQEAWSVGNSPFSSTLYSIDDHRQYPNETGTVYTNNDYMADVYLRRYFKVNSVLSDSILFSCSHDDAPAEWYLNGVLIRRIEDGCNLNGGWVYGDQVYLTAEQRALIYTDGRRNVLAIHVHNNWGGALADGGLYDMGSSEHGTQDGHEYVEIGGLKWATMNVGATTVAGSYETCYGDYFAWGETEPRYATISRSEGNSASFTWKSGYSSGYSSSNYPTFTGTTLDVAHDAATANWGSTWRTPTKAEFEALAIACSGSSSDGQTPVELKNTITEGGIYWLSSTQTVEPAYMGVAGLLFVSKADISNRVFFPASGYVIGTTLYNDGVFGKYWSSSLYTSNTDYAYYLDFDSSAANPWFYFYRYYGRTVRPVCAGGDASTLVNNITISPSILTLEPGQTQTLTATVLPNDANNKAVTWTSSNIGVATVDQTGKVTAVAAGTSIVTAIATDGSGVKAECKVTVEDNTHGFTYGHEWVDLGLPSATLWATCNVGAGSPEEYGDYFAWGETTGYDSGKTNFTWGTYKWCNGSNTTITKYCTNSGYGYNGFTDGKTELEAVDDAATANWGAPWHTPTEFQIQELINGDYTTTIWTTQNGVYGRKVTSKVNGNTLFLPAAGARRDATSDEVGSYGYYRSRSLSTDGSDYACGLDFSSGGIKWTNHNNRYRGRSVRPVCTSDSIQDGHEGGAETLVTSIILSEKSLKMTAFDTHTLTATVLPADATNKDVIWSSSNPYVATVDQTGKVTCITPDFSGCTIIATAADGSGVKATCEVTVESFAYPYPFPNCVDLGLPSGTLWATCNVGADSPEEYGDYFAWGETEPKEDYSWATYKYCNGSEYTMTKYCTKSNYGYNGFTDNKTELEPEDDAATVIWGDIWQIPSQAQCLELINSNYTTSKWTTLNGKTGMEITSKSNGNSIFLPAADAYEGTSLDNGAGTNGFYWSNSLDTSKCLAAYRLWFHSNFFEIKSNRRFVGRPIRPVLKQ